MHISDLFLVYLSKVILLNHIIRKKIVYIIVREIMLCTVQLRSSLRLLFLFDFTVGRFLLENTRPNFLDSWLIFVRFRGIVFFLDKDRRRCRDRRGRFVGGLGNNIGLHYGVRSNSDFSLVDRILCSGKALRPVVGLGVNGFCLLENGWQQFCHERLHRSWCRACLVDALGNHCLLSIRFKFQEKKTVRLRRVFVLRSSEK